MATFLAVFSILSGTASLMGLLHVLKNEVDIKFKKTTISSFAIATLVSIYIIIVPGTYVENMVQSKLQHYTQEGGDTVLIQKGGFSWGGTDPYSIMFPEPYMSPPKVEVINVNGYYHKPYVRRTTKHQVIFDRGGSGGDLIPQRFQSFTWVAEGTPMAKREK